MTGSARSVFSPIEDVVREAEERAQREWDREHQPCPHETLLMTLASRVAVCADCRAEVVPES